MTNLFKGPAVGPAKLLSWVGVKRTEQELLCPPHLHLRGSALRVVTSCCTSCVLRSCPSHSFQRCPLPHSPSRSRDQEQAGLLGEQETFISTLANFSKSQKLPKGKANPWDNLEVKKLSWDRIRRLFFLQIIPPLPSRDLGVISVLYTLLRFSIYGRFVC